LVRVATFNINNINKRLDNLLAWLAKAEPDVVSLQELKAEQEAFPVNALIADFDAGPKSSSRRSPRRAFVDR
jgi:exonuclease III